MALDLPFDVESFQRAFHHSLQERFPELDELVQVWPRDFFKVFEIFVLHLKNPRHVLHELGYVLSEQVEPKIGADVSDMLHVLGALVLILLLQPEELIHGQFFYYHPSDPEPKLLQLCCLRLIILLLVLHYAYHILVDQIVENRIVNLPPLAACVILLHNIHSCD